MGRTGSFPVNPLSELPSSSLRQPPKDIEEIVNRIKNHFKIKSIYLFGSAAKGNMLNDSDIDLVVILDESGFAKKYMELVNRRNRVSSLLIDIRRKIALDLLVYTRDEWQEMVDEGSSFIREIIENGKQVA